MPYNNMIYLFIYLQDAKVALEIKKDKKDPFLNRASVDILVSY